MAQAIQVWTSVDGRQFATEAEANAHEFMLENQEAIEVIAESFCNTIKAPKAKAADPAGLVGRTRAFNKNAAVQLLSFLMAKGVELPSDFEAVEPSEELQKLLDEEEAKVEAAKAKSEKTEAKVEEEAVEADEDMFAG